MRNHKEQHDTIERGLSLQHRTSQNKHNIEHITNWMVYMSRRPPQNRDPNHNTLAKLRYNSHPRSNALARNTLHCQFHTLLKTSKEELQQTTQKHLNTDMHQTRATLTTTRLECRCDHPVWCHRSPIRQPLAPLHPPPRTGVRDRKHDPDT